MIASWNAVVLATICWRHSPKHDKPASFCVGVLYNEMDWLDLAQDRVRWRALVNAVMNIRVP